MRNSTDSGKPWPEWGDESLCSVPASGGGGGHGVGTGHVQLASVDVSVAD